MRIDGHNCAKDWFDPDEARRILSKGREVKYAREMQAVVDRALEQIRQSEAVAK